MDGIGAVSSKVCIRIKERMFGCRGGCGVDCGVSFPGFRD